VAEILLLRSPDREYVGVRDKTSDSVANSGAGYDLKAHSLVEAESRITIADIEA